MESVKQTTLRSAKWSAIEKFSVQGVRFILGILMARLLSPSDYGVLSMITIFIVISETFVDSGFTLALVRQKSNSKADYSTVFYFNMGIAALCYVLLFFFAPFIADFFKTPIITPVLRVQSITVLINSLMAVYVAQMTASLDFKALAMRNMFASLISGGIGVALAYLGWGVWALVFQNLSGAIISMFFIFFYCRWIPKLEFSKDSFHRLFGFGKNILVVNIINRIYQNLTTIVIGRFFNAQALGYYDRGVSLATFPVDNINGILNKITLPILAKIQDEEERLINVYRKYISVTSFAIFFGCCLLASQANAIIDILFTAKWQAAAIYLQIYAFAIMFEHITTINLTLLQVKGRSDLFLKLEIWKKAISTLILFCSIPFGVIGICISKVIYTQIAILFNTYYTGKLFGIGYKEQFKDFSPYFIYAIIACLPSVIIAHLHLSNIISLTSGIAASIIIYYIIARKTEGMLELKTLILKRVSI